jgi:hypothetical protein
MTDDLTQAVAQLLVGRGAVRHGRNLRFRCVVHADRRPSADYEPERGLWVCRSCGAGGDVRDLARRLGIDPATPARQTTGRRRLRVPPPPGFTRPVWRAAWLQILEQARRQDSRLAPYHEIFYVSDWLCRRYEVVADAHRVASALGTPIPGPGISSRGRRASRRRRTRSRASSMGSAVLRDPVLEQIVARYAGPNGTGTEGAVTLAAVHEAFAHWLALPKPEDRSPYESIDLALATIVANRMEGDPLWLFLVAPPSGGKTEVIRALDDVPDVFALSALSPQTFASGFERRGIETSLLPKLDGKTVVMKDFGTVLTMYREAKAEILAQLREIYDGSFSKEWGNGKSLKWRGKVGLLAGVTEIIDREYSLNQILGERFLLYRLQRADARVLARAALSQRSREVAQRQALRDVVRVFLEGLAIPRPTLPAAIQEGLTALACFAALARSPIFTDPRGEIELIPEPEAPGRLVKQLAILAEALSVVRGEAAVSLET